MRPEKHPLVAEYERQHPHATLRMRACGHWEGVPVPRFPEGSDIDYRVEFWFTEDPQPPLPSHFEVDGLDRTRRDDKYDICGLCADRYETQRVMRLEAGAR